jgi:Amt family ammonium transporter
MGFLFFILVWHIAVYCPLAHMMWTNQGWFHQHYIEDFSGGLTVHMLSGLTAFCAHFFLGRDDIPHLPPVLNANETLKAAFLVWFLWFGYSAGKAHSAGAVAAQAIVNVFASSVASVLISFFHELIYERNVTPISVSTAILLGLVGITPAAGYVTVGGAMCIGIFTYLVTMTVANQLYLEGNTVNSPISVTTLHGLGGTVGFLCTAIGSYKFINPDAFDGATWGNGKPILYHFILTLLFYTCVTASIFIVLYVCDLIVPLKSSFDAEAEYPDFSFVTDSTAVNVPSEVTGASPRQASMRMNSARMNSLNSTRMNSGRVGVSRRLEMAVSRRMEMARSAKSGLGNNTDRTVSVGALGLNKNFRANAMKDLELTQSTQI